MRSKTKPNAAKTTWKYAHCYDMASKEGSICVFLGTRLFTSTGEREDPTQPAKLQNSTCFCFLRRQWNRKPSLLGCTEYISEELKLEQTEVPFNYQKEGRVLVTLQPERSHPGSHSQPHTPALTVIQECFISKGMHGVFKRGEALERGFHPQNC